MSTQIRPGQPSDLPAVAAIQSASPEASLWNPEDYLSYDFRVATLQDCLAGFLVTRTVADGEREILNLAVAPEFRRQGVARDLVRSFLEELNGAVYLEVRASNSAARNLYKSLGFQEVTVRKEYYDSPPEGGIVMKFHS